MPGSGHGGLAAVAWLVALALALAGGGALAGWSFYRRALRIEQKLRALESAVEEFCGALRARLMAERARLAPAESEAASDLENPPGRGEATPSEYRAPIYGRSPNEGTLG